MASPRKPSAKAKTPAAKPAAKSKVAPKKAATSAAPSSEFQLFAPEAREVCLTGDFCNWQTTEFKMRRFKDGTWKKKLKLKPGRYEYRFIVDGHWWTDPENAQRQYNPYGQENSVRIVP